MCRINSYDHNCKYKLCLSVQKSKEKKTNNEGKLAKREEQKALPPRHYARGDTGDDEILAAGSPFPHPSVPPKEALTCFWCYLLSWDYC